MKPRDLAFVLLINVLWGGNLVAVKVGVDHFSPILFSAVRFGLLALILLPWIRPQPGQMRQIMVVALAGGVLHFGIFFTGMRLADDVSSAAIVIQLNVPFATLLAVAFLGERIGWRRGLAIAVAFVGVVVIGFDPRVLSYIDAVLVLAVGAFVFAVGQVLMRRLRGVGVFALQGWMALVCAPSMLVLSLLLEEGQMAALAGADMRAVGAVLYATILGSLVGHGGAYYLIRRYPVSIVSPMFLLTPIFGIIAGVTLLDNVFTLQIALGALLTIGGVAVITFRSSRLAPEQAPTGP